MQSKNTNRDQLNSGQDSVGPTIESGSGPQGSEGLPFDPTDQWLGAHLTQQADSLAMISLSSRDSLDPNDHFEASGVPTVWQLRERILRRRERRARTLSLAASGAVLISILGWGVQSYRATDPYQQGAEGSIAGELQNIRPVSTSAGDGETQTTAEQSYQMMARWWEPVTVEWVDAEGKSLGVAGVVAEERTSMIDPRTLSPEQLRRLRNFLVESNSDRAKDQFTSSLEPAF